jgi:tRNA-dihydrouridine synthase
MLSAKALLHEDVGNTPFTKKRPSEGSVWYQLVLAADKNIPEVVDRLARAQPAALDLNAACPAPEMTVQGCGAALFRDPERFAGALSALRRSWSGPLTVKCRLGDEEPAWREKFVERLRIMESEGIDAVFVHPRFFKDKLKRRARWELFAWVASQTKVPVIANGDVASARQLEESGELFAPVSGLMVGRMAVVKPWIFRELAGEPVAVDYAATWSAFYRYVLDDFPPEKAIGRIKEFSKYFGQNFMFGHEFFRLVQSAVTLEAMRERAMGFLEAGPKVTNHPTVKGL